MQSVSVQSMQQYHLYCIQYDSRNWLNYIGQDYFLFSKKTQNKKTCITLYVKKTNLVFEINKVQIPILNLNHTIEWLKWLHNDILFGGYLYFFKKKKDVEKLYYLTLVVWNWIGQRTLGIYRVFPSGLSHKILDSGRLEYRR